MSIVYLPISANNIKQLFVFAENKKENRMQICFAADFQFQTIELSKKLDTFSLLFYSFWGRFWGRKSPFPFYITKLIFYLLLSDKSLYSYAFQR
ncbi:MAG: hypothetical protein IJ506_06570 [Clostridia bacterium]|nr:hypothetical protein [Clostridia bacterium]